MVHLLGIKLSLRIKMMKFKEIKEIIKEQVAKHQPQLMKF